MSSWDYWCDRAEDEQVNQKSTEKGTFNVLVDASVSGRSSGEDLFMLRRRILALHELGASTDQIGAAVGKHRATVRYHLRECGMIGKKGTAA